MTHNVYIGHTDSGHSLLTLRSLPLSNLSNVNLSLSPLSTKNRDMLDFGWMKMQRVANEKDILLLLKRSMKMFFLKSIGLEEIKSFLEMQNYALINREGLWG